MRMVGRRKVVHAAHHKQFLSKTSAPRMGSHRLYRVGRSAASGC